MVEHTCFFNVVACLRKDTYICICLKDFADKHCVVSDCELAVDFTFQMCNAFSDGWRFNFFAWHRC